ncbi:MAG: glucose-6-phosphate dehydrogenase [Nocardioidaceae bacterium]|nr:glucose-6-phosphate dehydrogenase [Nocardioidaceae bacterium]
MSGESIDRLVVLGAAGDLAIRHLLPALAHLQSHGGLPAALRVLGVGREPLTSQDYRDLAALQLAEHASGVDSAHRAALINRLDYMQADLERRPDLRQALGTGPIIAYLALPPSVYASAVQALQDGGIAPGSRIVIEKPFGTDLGSARELSRLLHTVVREQDVFRVDHFLYHQAVQDLLALRFANPIFEPLWSCEHLERVEITWEETAGVAGRAEFYDRTGALRDMVQSHLLQILALVAMEAPAALDERCLREEKVAVLRRVNALIPSEVATRTARGRYTAGNVQGQALRGYLQETGVDASRDTETYACLQLTVNVPRWHGVPFVLRTGKALGLPRRHIALHFRAARRGMLPVTHAVLCLEMAPDRLTLELQAVGPSGLPEVEPVLLEVARRRQVMPASARLLRDVLAGDPTLTVRDDEAEQCWRIIDSVLVTWRAGVPTLQNYAAGSAGPGPPVD